MNETIQAYASMANEYSERSMKINMDTHYGTFIPFMERNGPLSEQSLIDVGCGGGRDALYFSKKGINVIGIDATPEFATIAQENAPQALIMHRDIKNLDAFLPNYFDGLWSCAVHMHLQEKSLAVMHEQYRILKKQAPMYITVPVKENDTLESIHGFNRFYKAFSQDTLAELVKQPGFTIQENYLTNSNNRWWVNIVATK